MRAFPWLLSLLLVTAGCSADQDGVSSGGPFGDSLAGGASGPAGGGAGPETGLVTETTFDPSSPPIPTGDQTTTSGNGGGGGGDECVTTKASAPPASNPQVDIVWVVDSSQSMFDEQKRINQNLLQFADAITRADIDVSIVMVSRAPSLTGEIAIPLPGICADLPPDPLAGSALATDPRYHFVSTYVNSKEPLRIALSAYDRYAAFLRPGSKVHFVVVSDDDAGYAGLTPEERATQFEADMQNRLGRAFTLHTISSPGPSPCRATSCEFDLDLGIACVFLAATCDANAPGLTYYAAAERTGGLTASICESDWSPIFQTFQASIIESAPLPCDYVIPPPPTGDVLDPTKVNVAFTPAGAPEELIPQLDDPAACGANVAWHYDNPAAPTKVLLCPEACTRVSQGGHMDIAFGCDTVVVL